jgi:hypothetical protein
MEFFLFKETVSPTVVVVVLVVSSRSFALFPFLVPLVFPSFPMSMCESASCPPYSEKKDRALE